ncbi:MAG: non-hydrolyzing UDP-N-acetylglucosamine 2-epimerase [Planctomycetota bacterium]
MNENNKKTVNVVTIVGARPQFIKAAAVSRALASFNEKSSDLTINELIVHTGQHYDANMSQIFFDQLRIEKPHKNLEVGSGLHGRQTGLMLERIEQVLISEKPDCVLIYGDTNSTLAGAVAAAKLHIPVAHVEAGLRSFNRRMPEEINRVVADRLSNFLFCPTDTAVENLTSEGITEGIYKVGDVMYDSVLFNTELAAETSNIMEELKLEPKSFYLATIHRAENTDDPVRLENIFKAFQQMEHPIVLPLHPRTKKTLGAKLEQIESGLTVIEPVPYLDMLMLEKNSRLILTDSGGVQKEAYWFGVPCVTLRDETEWIELVSAGVNQVVGAHTDKIITAVSETKKLYQGVNEKETVDLYGDGHCAKKIAEILMKNL